MAVNTNVTVRPDLKNVQSELTATHFFDRKSGTKQYLPLFTIYRV